MKRTISNGLCARRGRLFLPEPVFQQRFNQLRKLCVGYPIFIEQCLDPTRKFLMAPFCLRLGVFFLQCCKRAHRRPGRNVQAVIRIIQRLQCFGKSIVQVFELAQLIAFVMRFIRFPDISLMFHLHLLEKCCRFEDGHRVTKAATPGKTLAQDSS